MAKTSAIQKNLKRIKLEKKYANIKGIKAAIKPIITHDDIDLKELTRFIIHPLFQKDL